PDPEADDRAEPGCAAAGRHAGRRQDVDRDPGDHERQDLPGHVRQAPDGRADRGPGDGRRDDRSYATARMTRSRRARGRLLGGIRKPSNGRADLSLRGASCVVLRVLFIISVVSFGVPGAWWLVAGGSRSWSTRIPGHEPWRP